MEVMVATGIMAIGLVCIMALFPIGAVNMARAITQDRSTTHGVNSDQTFRYYWKAAWNDPNGGNIRASNADAYYFSQEPMLWAFENHPNKNYGINGTIPAGAAAASVGLPTLSQPSFPVLVDPVGFLTKAGTNDQFLIAGQSVLPSRTTLRRCINVNGGYWYDPTLPSPPAPGPWPNPPFPYPQFSPPTPVVRNTALLDDMTFARPGDGSTFSVMGEPADFTGQIERAGRYNVAWLVYRPRNDIPAEANVSVLVYAARSATDTPSQETAFNAYAAPGQKNILVQLGGQVIPNLRRGGWIAFHRIIRPPTNAPQAFVPYMTFDFYRVSGINSDIAGFLALELESPIKPALPGTYAIDQTYGPSGIAVVFDNLVEVFDRGTVSAAGATKQ